MGLRLLGRAIVLDWVVAPCHHKGLDKREVEEDWRQMVVSGQSCRDAEPVRRPAVSVRAITGLGSHRCGGREVPRLTSTGWSPRKAGGGIHWSLKASEQGA